MNIQIIVFTNFFKREKKLYALGDISLTRPISFKLAGNLLLCIGLWTVPLCAIFGFSSILSSPLIAAIYIGPAIGDGFLISKPSAIFNNKSFYSFVACQVKYLFEPKYYTDLKVSKINDGDKIDTDFSVWLGDSWLDDYGNPLPRKEAKAHARAENKNRKKTTRSRK